jgi:hypothetical protein
MRWQSLLVLFLLLTNPAVSVSAEPDTYIEPPANWNANCRSTLSDFSLNFKSASDVWSEDDQSIELSLADGRSLTFPFKKSAYSSRTTLLNVNNLCDRVVALDMGNSNVLFMLSESGRPGYDFLGAVLVDIKNLNVLDARTQIGNIKTDGFVVRPATPNGFDVRLIKENLENSGCDCGDADIEDWLHIGIKKGKLEFKWTLPR